MKIKYLIDTILSPKIQVLDFVDRYAGIVRTINIAEGNGTETGIVKRYPLACNVTGVDCANIGIYQNLVPDDSKKSVIYWEMVSPMQNTGMTKTRDFYRKRFKGTARLVVWLNLAKLGIDNCTDSILVLPILEKEITTKGKITGGVYDGDLLWIEPLRMVNQDINTIFGKYDYNKLKNYYLYPFDFFAIDVQFTLEQCLSKGGAFPCTVPLDCPNEINNITDCKSLLLDGVNELIKADINAAYNFDINNTFSLSVWIKANTISTVSSNFLLAKYSNPPARGYYIAVQANKIVFSLQSNGGTNGIIVATVNTFNTNQWYNIVATYDGSSFAAGVKIYVNGINEPIDVTSDTLTASILTLEPLTVGGTTTPPRYFDGYVASSRVWDIELNAADIITEYNGGQIKNIPIENNSNILNTDISNAIWNGSEFIINDLSSTGVVLSSINSEENDLQNECPTNITDCKSLLLDGVNEYINCSNNTAFDLNSTQGFTLSATFKKLGGVYLPIIQKLDTVSNLNVTGYRLYIGPTNEIVFNLIGGNTLNRLTVSTPPIINNVWYNVTLTYNGSETAAGVNIYIDGILQPLTIFIDNYIGSLINTQILTLGGQPTPLDPLYGFCNYAAAKMWDIELTETEVLNFYNCSTSIPKQENLILNTNIGGATWTGSAFNIPDLTAITTGYTSVNSEEIDLTTECP
jgi:hypothetical protein